MNVTPRVVGLLALVAIAPVGAYVVFDELIAVVAVVNVVLIAASLAIALSPHEPPADTTPNGT